jgi:O-antigen ligase
MIKRGRPYVAAALLSFAIVFGGNGGPLLDLAIELGALLLLALVLVTPVPVRGRWWACAALILIAMVPALQLVPLPATIWHALPGREVAVAAMRQAGFGDAPHALSLNPGTTFRSALYLLPAAALFLSTLRAGAGERRALIALAVVLILASMVLGMLQVAGGESFYFYETAHEGNAVGFLMNRNHHADMLLIGVALLPALAVASAAPDGRPRRMDGTVAGRLRAFRLPREVAAAIAAMLAIAVVGTISRAGLLLAPPTLIAALILLYGTRRRFALVVTAVLILVGLAGAALVMLNPMAGAVAERFLGAAQDSRTLYWQDTLFAIRRYWPWGSGLGTFIPVYASVESLDTVGPDYVNHAHNEYLELLLDTGLAGIAAFAAGMAALAAGAGQRRGPDLARMRWSALIGIAVIMLHSIVDYPLRTLSLITLFGLLAGLVFAGPDACTRPPLVPGRPRN